MKRPLVLQYSGLESDKTRGMLLIKLFLLTIIMSSIISGCNFENKSINDDTIQKNETDRSTITKDTMYDIIIHRYKNIYDRDSLVKSFDYDEETGDKLLVMTAEYGKNENLNFIKLFREDGSITIKYSFDSPEKINSEEKLYNAFVTVFNKDGKITSQGNIKTSDSREFTNFHSQPPNWIKTGEWKYFGENKKVDSVLKWSDGNYERIK